MHAQRPSRHDGTEPSPPTEAATATSPTDSAQAPCSPVAILRSHSGAVLTEPLPAASGPRQYYVETFGCQMNEYDSAMVAGQLEKHGWTRTTEAAAASLILINTCSVREKAEETAIGRLKYLRHHKKARPELRIGVLGCMAENRGDALFTHETGVDFALGPDHYDRLGEFLAFSGSARTALGPDITQNYAGLFAEATSGASAFVAIQRGCDFRCAYCIVPSTRGPERSRPVSDIEEEIRRLVDRGVAEVTLLGQTVNAWSDGDLRFDGLLRRLDRIAGLRRIRFTSPHPRYFTESVLRAMADCAGVCRHIHMPVQSGSTAVLRAMRRQYTREQYLRIVERIEQFLPGAAISTDIIAGFPGETAEDHRQTLSLMEAVRFDHAFMFAYSPRPGTPSFPVPETLDPAEKSARLAEIIALQQRHTFERLDSCVGSTAEILLERPSRRDAAEWIGKTPESRKVVVLPPEAAKSGDLLAVRIVARRGQVLWGEAG